MKSFNDKVIIITGAGSGIGRELALQLSKRGALLALNDWNPETLEQTAEQVKAQGGTCVSQVFDVGDRRAWEIFVSSVVDHFGHLNGLINNAGLTIFSVGVKDVDPVDFERVLKVNLWGAIHGTQVALPYLLERPEALVCNVSSLLGLIGYGGQTPYVTSKFALRGFTESLRQEMKGTGVNVVQVHPGPIRTNLLRNAKHENKSLLQRWAAKYDQEATLDGAQAATIIVKGLAKGKLRIVFGHRTPLLDRMARFFPSHYHKLIPSRFKNGSVREEAKAEERIAQARRKADEGKKLGSEQ